MVLVRFISYFGGIALVMWLLISLEISGPGSLKIYSIGFAGGPEGTSEFSLVEHMQAGILVLCGLFYAWVAHFCAPQRPIALLFCGLAGIIFLRELNYFLDQLVADNFWQTLMAVVAALLIVYIYRHWLRFRIAWLRIWPSPGLTLLFAGAIVIFAVAPLIANELLWQTLVGEQYQHVASFAVEELSELLGYFLFLAGTIEYTYQAKVVAFQPPVSAVAKRRAGRQPKSAGRF